MFLWRCWVEQTLQAWHVSCSSVDRYFPAGQALQTVFVVAVHELSTSWPMGHELQSEQPWLLVGVHVGLMYWLALQVVVVQRTHLQSETPCVLYQPVGQSLQTVVSCLFQAFLKLVSSAYWPLDRKYHCSCSVDKQKLALLPEF